MTSYASNISLYYNVYILPLLMAIISGALLVTMPWIYVTNGNATDVALYFGIYALTSLLYNPISGLITDFFQTSKIFLLINLIKIFAISMFIFSNIQNPITKYMAPVLIGLSDTQFRTISGKLLKFIFERNDSVNVADRSKLNARYFGMREIGYMLGTATAGYSLHFLGNSHTLFVLILVSLMAGVTSIFIPIVGPSHTAKLSKNKSDLFCISYSFKNRALIKSIALFSLIALPLRLAPMIASPLVYTILNSSALVLGNMELSWSIGALAGNAIIGGFYKSTMANLFKRTCILALIICYLSLLIATPIFAIITYFFIGIFGQTFVFYLSEIQESSAQDNIGRVSSLSSFISTIPVILYSLVAQVGNIQNYLIPLFLCVGALCLAFVITFIEIK